MIEKLIKTLSSTDFEEYGDLFLQEVNWSDDAGILTLKIEINMDDDFAFPSKWEVVCEKVRTHRLSLGRSLDFRFDLDHVLSWEYFKPCCSVSFYGGNNDSLSVVGALYKAHTEIARDWIPFNKYFNQHIQLDKLIAARFGQIVENAPDEFSIAYENVMQGYGFSTSRGESHLPFYWRDNTFPTATSLPTMIFDKSYVVAEEFKARAI